MLQGPESWCQALLGHPWWLGRFPLGHPDTAQWIQLLSVAISHTGKWSGWWLLGTGGLTDSPKTVAIGHC